MMDSFKSIQEKCDEEGKDFYEAVMEDEIRNTGLRREEIFEKMRGMWKAMFSAVKNYDPAQKSRSGLAGGDGGKFQGYASMGNSLCGGYISRVIETALKMGECNACMNRIVACPTAGSCGVMPAVLVPLSDEGRFTEDEIVRSLFVGAGIGQVIAKRASISGAEGGCQAEIGTASSMAAGTLVYLMGGNCRQIISAAGFAIKNLLGLVCDPVAGLVEIPCIKRNVIGAVNAASCADMALAGITSFIPSDEIADAMKSVGNRMDVSLRETGLGGIAGTPSGKMFRQGKSIL